MKEATAVHTDELLCNNCGDELCDINGHSNGCENEECGNPFDDDVEIICVQYTVEGEGFKNAAGGFTLYRKHSHFCDEDCANDWIKEQGDSIKIIPDKEGA